MGLALLQIFFFLLESRANKFFYLFEGVPTFVTKGVPKYRANIKNFNNYIQKKKKIQVFFQVRVFLPNYGKRNAKE